MTWGDFAQVVTAAGILITAVGTFRNGRGIKDVVKHTNSMKDELVKEVRVASFAAGEKAEKDKSNG